jgi:hypothetical protein
VYGLFAIFCVLAGAVNNRIGLNWGLVLGSIGYPLYGAGLYCNNQGAVTWFLLFGSALCGISAGFFWAAYVHLIAAPIYRVEYPLSRAAILIKQ